MTKKPVIFDTTRANELISLMAQATEANRDKNRVVALIELKIEDFDEKIKAFDKQIEDLRQQRGTLKVERETHLGHLATAQEDAKPGNDLIASYKEELEAMRRKAEEATKIAEQRVNALTDQIFRLQEDSASAEALLAIIKKEVSK